MLKFQIFLASNNAHHRSPRLAHRPFAVYVADPSLLHHVHRHHVRCLPGHEAFDVRRPALQRRSPLGQQLAAGVSKVEQRANVVALTQSRHRPDERALITRKLLRGEVGGASFHALLTRST